MALLMYTYEAYHLDMLWFLVNSYQKDLRVTLRHALY